MMSEKVVQNIFYLSSLFIGRTFTYYTFNHTGGGVDSMDTDGKEESVTGVLAIFSARVMYQIILEPYSCVK